MDMSRFAEDVAGVRRSGIAVIAAGLPDLPLSSWLVESITF